MSNKDFKVAQGVNIQTPLPLSMGGTGQTSASNTLNALLPVQTSNSGKYLSTDGTNTSWVSIVAIPSQTGNSGKFLTTDGSSVSWGSPTLSTSYDGGVAATVYTGGINGGGAS